MPAPTYTQRIRDKLTKAFTPTSLEINDDSNSHVGHAGHHPSGETHFSITIVSAVFVGLSRVERHRKVYGALTEEMNERVHALSLTTFTPDEYQPKVEK